MLPSDLNTWAVNKGNVRDFRAAVFRERFVIRPLCRGKTIPS